SQPRRLRGVIKMDPVPSTLTEPMIVTYLATLLQEVGHFWLVPGNLKIKVNGTPDRMATDVELTQAINDDAPFPHLPLIGRSNNHWSADWQSGGSPMDGLC